MKNKISVEIGVLIFREDNNIIAYSPALDLSGYGKNENEAIKSFKLTLEEFFRYTLNKETFESELERLGWKYYKTDKKIEPPYLIELLKNNNYLSDIIREKEYKKYNQNIEFPVYA